MGNGSSYVQSLRTLDVFVLINKSKMDEKERNNISMCTNTILVFHRLTDPPSLVCLLGEVSSLCLNLRLSSLLAVVWSAVATFAGCCLHWC